MQLLIYLLFYPLLWIISKMPFRILYFLSDFAYLILYKIIGYRKTTVRKNLLIALPHLSTQERKIIERKFYHHFCDSFLEMIKTLTISEEEMEKRFKIENIELIRELEAQQKSIVLICAHYSSYEWLLVVNKHIKFKGFGVYKKLRNKYFDRLIKNVRSKFGATLLNSKETKDRVKENQENKILGFYGFISDQSPRIRTINHFTNFFGKKVPVFTGAEFLAKKLEMNVVFVKGQKLKRGYYKATFILPQKEVKTYSSYELTDEFLQLLEKQIIENPEYYLWTHKRFKHNLN